MMQEDNHTQAGFCKTHRVPVTDHQLSAMFWSLQNGLTSRERRAVIHVLERMRRGEQLTDQSSDDVLWEDLCRRALRRNQHQAPPDPTEVISILEWTSCYGKCLTAGAPLALHVRRPSPRFASRSVAIIGARHPTFAARREAFHIAKELTRQGFFIWSGAAIGIDTVALSGALDAQRTEATGTAYPMAGAVVGGGLHHPYPPSNRLLFTSHHLALLSESAPEVRARPWHFPQRNFVIAWLADYVLVVEAKQNSGSLITAHEAASLGKGVGAWIWPEAHSQAAGNRELIELGADPIRSTADILRAFAQLPLKQEAQGCSELHGF